MGLARRRESSFSRSLNFSVSLVFFWEFHKICKILKFHVPQSLLRDWLHDWSSGGEKKNYIVYCLVCIFIIISISIFFCCFIKLSLSQPQVSPFVHSPHPTEGEGEGWASGRLLLVAGCQVKPRHLENQYSGRKRYSNIQCLEHDARQIHARNNVRFVKQWRK